MSSLLENIWILLKQFEHRTYCIPPPFSTKNKKGQRANHSRFSMKSFIWESCWSAESFFFSFCYWKRKGRLKGFSFWCISYKVFLLVFSTKTSWGQQRNFLDKFIQCTKARRWRLSSFCVKNIKQWKCQAWLSQCGAKMPQVVFLNRLFWSSQNYVLNLSPLHYFFLEENLDASRVRADAIWTKLN